MGWLLEICDITKSFSGVPVLNGVSLSLQAGEIHALVGENGAGKSTLMKVVAGLHQPDAGELRLDGNPTRFRSPHEALQAGVAMIHQELLPFLDLTVAENIFMGIEPVSGPGWIDRPALHRKTVELLDRLGLKIPPDRRMRELRVAEMQTVEILKALAHNARLIIMDEPTSALTDREAGALFAILNELRQRGTSIIYISHKLEEVFRLADRVTILRDGCHVATHPISGITTEALISLMVGRPLANRPRSAPGPAAPPILSVRNLALGRRFNNVSFDLAPGEVLGIAGLMGAGRSSLLSALYGLDPADSGEISIGGRALKISSPRNALDAGIGLVTEDRKVSGFIPLFGPRQNMTLAALGRWCRFGWIDQAAESAVADEQIRLFGIRASGRDQPVLGLSGGNQQKVVLARSMLAGPGVLLLDEPTRGIDIAAKEEVHRIVSDLARNGTAILLVSSELPELLSLSHRLLVMCEGRITGTLDPRTTTQEEILKLAMPG